MANYDAAGDKIKRNYHIPLWMMLFGVVITTIGIIWCCNTNWEKYMKLESFSEVYDGTQITDCDISFSVGESNIVKSTDGKIHLTADNVPQGIYTYGVDNDRFYLNVKKNTFNFNNFLSFVRIGNSVNFDNLKITIELPEKIYDRIEIDNGVGQLTISDVQSKKASVCNGVGELNFNNCIFADVNVDNGVGSTNFNQVTFGNTDLENGVGEIRYNGRIEGDLSIDNGVGSCNLILYACRNDFKISNHSDSDVTVSGSGCKTSGSSYKIDADNGIGEIDIEFVDIA